LFLQGFGWIVGDPAPAVDGGFFGQWDVSAWTRRRRRFRQGIDGSPPGPDLHEGKDTRGRDGESKPLAERNRDLNISLVAASTLPDEVRMWQEFGLEGTAGHTDGLFEPIRSRRHSGIGSSNLLRMDFERSFVDADSTCIRPNSVRDIASLQFDHGDLRGFFAKKYVLRWLMFWRSGEPHFSFGERRFCCLMSDVDSPWVWRMGGREGDGWTVNLLAEFD